MRIRYNEVLEKIKNSDYIIKSDVPIPYGKKITLNNGAIICCYDTGKCWVQGKNVTEVVDMIINNNIPKNKNINAEFEKKPQKVQEYSQETGNFKKLGDITLREMANNNALLSQFRALQEEDLDWAELDYLVLNLDLDKEFEV